MSERRTVSTVMISPAGSALEEANSCTMPGVLEEKREILEEFLSVHEVVPGLRGGKWRCSDLVCG
jgi:hypothetical protein